MYALTEFQVDIFSETRVFPQSGIDCDNPAALVQAAATHIVALNQDLNDTYSCRVRATYFAVSQPFGWLVFLGIGLIGAGLILTGVVLIRRD